MTTIELKVNGRSVKADVSPRTHLADLLREDLRLTGTHIGCEHGICGACTVEINGEIARSCITYAVSADGADVRTIEGFDDDAMMEKLRQAFTAEHALQCGYCTPGMLVAARDLIKRRGQLSRPEIRTEMSGNLCRCTGYMGIVNAIERVMAETKAQPSAATTGWLGPAPGPVAGAIGAASAPAAQKPAAAATPVATAAVKAKPAAARGKRIPLTMGELGSDGEFTTITQSFVLEHPRAEVWRIVSDPEKLAPCLPGMALDGPVVDGQVKGRAEVALGPITARFAGDGTVERDDANFEHRLAGQGRDQGSSSRAKGRVRIKLDEGPAPGTSTKVDIAIAYALSGPLAQFSRSSLVKDVVVRMGQAFAQNLDAVITSPDGAPLPAAKLSAFDLMWGIIKGRIARLFGLSS